MTFHIFADRSLMQPYLKTMLIAMLILALVAGCSSKDESQEKNGPPDEPTVSQPAQEVPTASQPAQEVPTASQPVQEMPTASQPAEEASEETSPASKAEDNERSATSLSKSATGSGTSDSSGLQPSTTELAPVPQANILWQTDHETGDFYEWSKGSGWLYWDEAERKVVKNRTGPRIFGQAIYNSNTPPGDCVATISDEVSRSGNYALKMDLSGATKATQGCRVFRTWLNSENEAELPDEGYYSAWYYLPQEVTTALWWNVFQFKSASDKAGNEAMLSFNIESDGAGKRNLYVYHKKGDDSCDCLGSCVEDDYEEINNVNLPLKEWFHVEAFVKQSSINGDKVNEDGALQVWVNDIQIVDEANICTLLRSDAKLHWSVNNYTDEITPSDVLLYVDDAAISADRVGTGQQ